MAFEPPAHGALGEQPRHKCKKDRPEAVVPQQIGTNQEAPEDGEKGKEFCVASCDTSHSRRDY
jgi:hypothetical protein